MCRCERLVGVLLAEIVKDDRVVLPVKDGFLQLGGVSAREL